MRRSSKITNYLTDMGVLQNVMITIAVRNARFFEIRSAVL